MFDGIYRPETSLERTQRRMRDGAKLYAASDRSDPFVYARALTHIANGVASVSRPGNQEYAIPQGVPACYSADSHLEERKVAVGERTVVAQVVVYRNVQRP
jgi:hypothetical protein